MYIKAPYIYVYWDSLYMLPSYQGTITVKSHKGTDQWIKISLIYVQT